jgi:hypothetical protein
VRGLLWLGVGFFGWGFGVGLLLVGLDENDEIGVYRGQLVCQSVDRL